MRKCSVGTLKFSRRMAFKKPKKVGAVKFDPNERRDFLKTFSSKKKKVDKKKVAKEKLKKEVFEKRQERRKAQREQEQQSQDHDLHVSTETNRTNAFQSCSPNDPFGDVTVTTTTWE